MASNLFHSSGGLLPNSYRNGSTSNSVRLGFAVHKVALEQVFSWYFFLSLSVFTPPIAPHSFIIMGVVQ
jgi:hypothetical protein